MPGIYNRKLIFWSACSGMLLFGTAIIALGSIAPDLNSKLGLDEVSSGTLFSILPVGILGGSLIFGPVADRFGYKILLSVSCILLFGGFEGLAFATDKTKITFFVFLVGFSGGAINGATNAMMADITDKNKGANLSLLGVFFAIGALGMPAAMGILRGTFSFETIVAAVGILSLLFGVLYLFIRFPDAKQSQGLPFSEIILMLKDGFIILVSFFLFFQSSFEAIINNWTTSYLISELKFINSHALFGLSVYVGGMAIMRLIIGSFLRSSPERRILYVSFLITFAALILLMTVKIPGITYVSLFMLGAGLAGGFPIMLGLTGARYTELSGTAFSIVLSIALIGNMSVNFLMGLIAKTTGIKHLISVAMAELVMLVLLSTIILNRMKSNIK